MSFIKIIFLTVLSSLIVGCSSTRTIVTTDKGISLLDTRDKKTYTIEKIDNLYWTVENGAFDLPLSRCYNELDSNCIKSGKIYTWEQAKSSCPKGWRLPTSDELISLFLKFGKISYSGNNTKFREIFGIYEPEKTSNTFKNLMQSNLNLPVFDKNSKPYQQRTLFWSSDENPRDSSRVYAIYWNSKGNDGQGAVFFSHYPKNFYGFCRCVKEITKN